MANENKRYYWLKLKEDFFDDDAIEWLEEQPNGKEYSLLYLKLCLKSLKTNGILIRTVGNMLIPYDLKKLSEITKTDIDTVTVAMELLKKIGLVEIFEDGKICIPHLQDMVGSETKWAMYKRNERLENVQSNSNLLPNNVHTEIEKEIEKESEIEKEIEDIHTSKVAPVQPQTIVDMYNSICISYPKVTKLSENRKKAIRARLKMYSVEEFQKLFEMAEGSSFLKGSNNRNWSANFDWLVKDANMAKVLDGNYSDQIESKSKEPEQQENYLEKWSREIEEARERAGLQEYEYETEGPFK